MPIIIKKKAPIIIKKKAPIIYKKKAPIIEKTRHNGNEIDNINKKKVSTTVKRKSN